MKAKYPIAYKHIKKFETTTNKTGIALPEVLKTRKPFWYSCTRRIGKYFHFHKSKPTTILFVQQIAFVSQSKIGCHSCKKE
ncbi:MAG TPA: hypothetical protein DEG63_02995 [Flavobacteriaceae bacterium]|nr:hypothetical protein [Flavobacteriaceae bacterium]